MLKWFSLALGGIVGTLARYLFSGAIYKIFGSEFPYGTLAVNLSGCFFIGFLSTISEEKFLLSPNLRVLLLIGFCGAFTTFSTFILESVNLIRDGEVLRALVNVVASVIAGFLVFWFGVFVAEQI